MKGSGICPAFKAPCCNGKPHGGFKPFCAWWDEYENDCAMTIIVREMRYRHQQ